MKFGGSINFDGDFIVKDKIDVYGVIIMNGNVSCVYVFYVGMVFLFIYVDV